MATDELWALGSSALTFTVGLILVLFRRLVARHMQRERTRLGLHVGPESHPVMLLIVGLGFIAMATIILLGTYTDVLT